MFYYLHLLKDTAPFHAFNVFQYVTFRAIAAAVTAFLLSLIIGNSVIRELISLKIGQPIRGKDEVHKLSELHGSKKGTPTMGGVMIIWAVIVSSLLWAQISNVFVQLTLFSIAYLGAVGFIDDYLKVVRRSSNGMSGRMKLALQFALAGGVSLVILTHPSTAEYASSLHVPFSKVALVNMGILAVAFHAVVMVGSSNAVNLTDGLDGLATGVTMNVAASFAVLTYVAGHFDIARYLQIPHHQFNAELAIVAMALTGAAMGFLWFNCHPAKVFMGDTGSLAIGGTLGVMAICCKQEILLAVVGGVFVIEAMSVILQVASFKLTGRRIFLMSPIHHHFELLGWKENTVIVRFWILSLVLALIGLATLKLR